MNHFYFPHYTFLHNSIYNLDIEYREVQQKQKGCLFFSIDSHRYSERTENVPDFFCNIFMVRRGSAFLPENEDTMMGLSDCDWHCYYRFWIWDRLFMGTLLKRH
jgi:hypothetical protein